MLLNSQFPGIAKRTDFLLRRYTLSLALLAGVACDVETTFRKVRQQPS
jgi:hypothetical protein